MTGFRDYGEAKTASWPRGPRPSPEAFEQVCPVRLWDARPAVSNTECSVASKGYGDLRTYRCVADGILDEVACDLGYRLLGGPHHEGLTFHVKSEGDVRCRC